MKRFARHLFTVFTLIMLLALVGVIAVWVESREDRIEWKTATTGHTYEVIWRRGELCVMWFQKPTPNWNGLYGSEYSSPDRRVLGFGYNAAPAGDPAPRGRVWASHGVVVMPIGFVAALCLLPSILWTALYLRRRRRSALAAAGQCLNCGYDLRASPNVCPECGTPVA